MKISEQGFDTNRYKVIVRTLIFVFYHDEILLIKGAESKRIWANLYNGIGGHIEAGEDLHSAAKRELFEETGIVCDRLKQNGSIIINMNTTEGILIHIFSGIVQSKQFTPGIEGDLHWVSVDNLNSLPLVEDLLEIIPMILDPKIEYISGLYQFEGEKLIRKFNNINQSKKADQY